MAPAIRLACTLIAFFLALSAAAFAAPAVTVWPTVGPPTSKVIINGTGFGAFAAIDAYYDTTHLCLTFATSTGAASCTITVPKDAQPQWHWVSMLQRNNGTGAQKPHLVRTDMAQFHGRNAAHTGFNPFENTLNPSNAADLDILWSAPIGPTGTDSSPVIAGGRVYVGARDGKLYAFNALTGAPVAGFPKTLDGAVNLSSPAVGYGNVFIGTIAPDNKLYGFNAATGAVAAGFPKSLSGSIRSAPAVALGNVYVGTDNNRLYAFNATTGLDVTGFPKVPGPLGDSVTAPPSIADGRVYVGTSSGWFNAFDALTGAAVPDFPIIANGNFPNAAAMAGTFAYVVNTNQNVYIINTEAPMSWGPVSLGGVEPASSPAVAGGRVFVAVHRGPLIAFNRFTFDRIWSIFLGGTVFGVNGSPVVANGVVFATGYRVLNAVSADTGALLWYAEISTCCFASPAVANGIVYLGSITGRLYAFSVNGEVPSAALPGGALGVKPALSALKPDLSLKPQ